MSNWQQHVNPLDLEKVWQLCQHTITYKCNGTYCSHNCNHIKKCFLENLTLDQFYKCLENNYKNIVRNAQKEIDSEQSQIEAFTMQLKHKNDKLKKDIQTANEDNKDLIEYTQRITKHKNKSA